MKSEVWKPLFPVENSIFKVKRGFDLKFFRKMLKTIEKAHFMWEIPKNPCGPSN